MKGKTIDEKAVLFVGVFFLVLVVYISARYTHFRVNLNLFDAYDLRNEARTYRIPLLLDYAFYWSKAVNPFLLGYCIINKRRLSALLFLCVQLLSFSIDGLKSTFFMILIVLFCCLIYKHINFSKIYQLFSKGLMIIAFLSILEKVVIKSSSIAILVIRRLLIVPNQLGEYYFEFFETHPYDYFRGSILRYFGFVSPYASQGGITQAVGQYFFNSGNNSNNGLATDAMTNVGLIGFFVMPLLVVFVLRCMDRSSVGVNKGLILIAAIYVAEILLSTFLATALITHGLLLIIILLTFMSQEDDKPELRLQH